MLKRIAGNKAFYPILLIVVFSLLSAFSLFMNGDDYFWYYIFENKELEAWVVANGRLFSNKITYWLVRSFAFRTIFVWISFAAFLILLGKLFDFKNVLGRYKYYLVLLFFVFIPHSTYAETVNWISGYTNYVFSMLCIFIYLSFVFKCFFKDYSPKIYSSFAFLILALIGGLCVEHVTIYNVFLAVAVLFIAFKLNKKCILHAVFFLVGTVVSCLIMFGNNNYSEIKTEDSIGMRAYVFSYSDIMHNAFTYVVKHYTKDFWLISIILTLSFTFFYIKSDFNEKKPKYLNVCMAICWLYSAYSIFTMCISDFRAITPAMRVVALETAFSFIYVVAIAYLVYVFFDKNNRLRLYLYLISTFLLTAPFVFIKPATPRCFFANYMFWILLCGELLTAVIKSIDKRYTKKIGCFVCAFSLCSVFCVMTACLTNKHINTIRYDYIKEQLQGDKNRQIKLILLPYIEFHHDDLSSGLINSDDGSDKLSYSEFILKYYDIEVDKDKEYKEIKVSPYDYYIEKASE